jgi:hypothetical protein
MITNYKILYQFNMAWIGWECDSDCYIIEKDDKKYLLTRQPSSYLTLPNVSNVEIINILEGKIQEYQILIDSTMKALSFFKS